ncbi:LOW QUALITY PROTEIN: IS6 family transposase, partial [Streptomyces viridosporus ATCC 14672]
ACHSAAGQGSWNRRPRGRRVDARARRSCVPRDGSPAVCEVRAVLRQQPAPSASRPRRHVASRRGPRHDRRRAEVPLVRGRPGRQRLDILVQNRCSRAAAGRFRHRLFKGIGAVPRVIVIDRPRSCRAARREVMSPAGRRFRQGLNHRAENSRQPTRQRERAMKAFAALAELSGSCSRSAAFHPLPAPPAPDARPRPPHRDDRLLRRPGPGHRHRRTVRRCLPQTRHRRLRTRT